MQNNGNSTVVYTANYGDTDDVLRPYFVLPKVDYLIFSDVDSPACDSVWSVVVVPSKYDDPCRNAKRMKILAHKYLGDYSRSIWVDGNVRLRAHPLHIWRRFHEDIALFRHPKRQCVYEESVACLKQRKDDPEIIARVVSEMKSDEHPADWGLWWGGVIFRRHTDVVRSFNSEWWECIERGSRRDQLSLPFILRRTGLSVHSFANEDKRLIYRQFPHKKMNLWTRKP